MNPTTLTPILGTDKSNPAFSVFVPEDDPKFYEVYFGLALLEKVNGDTKGMQFKYLVGRLYNAGIKRAKLVEAFDLPLSTIRRYGEAVKSDDPEDMMRRFSGQGAVRKLTPEIENYVRCEFRELYPENKYTYSSAIISKVKEIFDVPLSSETLRPIFNEEKRALSEKDAAGDCLANAEKAPDRASVCDCERSPASNKSDNRRYSLSNFDIDGEPPEPFLLKHAGLSLLLPSINDLSLGNKLAEQWIGSVLLGAKNIEQSGRLDFRAMEYLLNSKPVSSTNYQRRLLRHLAADRRNIMEMFHANAAFIGLHEKNNIFFYDPHGVKYTGMKNILKGWCGSVGKIGKVNYQDFIHTTDGCPVYFEIHDNYLDMRERLLDELDVFHNEILPGADKPTLIVDRGVYGRDKMIEIDSKGYGLVTWGKNYDKDAWDDGKEQQEFKIQRARNNSKDVRTWDVRFIRDDAWSAIENYHRLIVRITPPGSTEEYEVPIITNGKIDDLTAVRLMLIRWIQENDYRYLDRNFGINEITTYKDIDYAELNLREKEVYSETRDFLSRKKRKAEAKLKALLLDKEKKTMRGKTFSRKKRKNIEELKKRITELEDEVMKASEKVDKASKLAALGKRRLAYNSKYYMDAVKITAKNIFSSLLGKFRPYLDNYRDDHQLLRELTRASGYIEYKDSGLSIQLHPDRNYQPAQRKAILRFLAMISQEINEKNPYALPVEITLSTYMSHGYPSKKQSV